MPLCALRMMFGVATVLAIAQSASAQDVIPPKVYSTTPGGINVSDGSLVYSVIDLAIGPLKLERFHVTGLRKPNKPFFGKNMSHNFDIYVARNLVHPEPAPANQAPYRPIVHLGARRAAPIRSSKHLARSAPSISMRRSPAILPGPAALPLPAATMSIPTAAAPSTPFRTAYRRQMSPRPAVHSASPRSLSPKAACRPSPIMGAISSSWSPTARAMRSCSITTLPGMFQRRAVSTLHGTMFPSQRLVRVLRSRRLMAMIRGI